MSYCVNCGVELDDSAAKCALCNTPVINPNKQEKSEDVITPFASETYIPNEVTKRFVAGLISAVMIIPNIVCFFLNIFFFTQSFWSLYICATSFFLWIIFVFPFFTKKLKPFLMWGFDTVASALYLWILSYLLAGEWFFNCALPTVIFNSFLVLTYMLWTRKKKRHWVYKLFYIFTCLAVSIFISSALVSAATDLVIILEIGIIVSLCLITVVAFLCYCYLSKGIRRWIKKRFFV